MNEKPNSGLYFLVTTNLWGIMAGKIIEHLNDNDCEVKILKTNMDYYKDRNTAIIFLFNNPAITVEYFKHEYELLAKVI